LIKSELLGEPQIFWEYFLEITKIPRCSEHEEKIREYIKSEAQKLGFNASVDKVGNLLVTIPNSDSKKNLKTLILQSHLDMVCEKNESIDHDFTKDPLNLKIEKIENTEWITAEGTTLGADNGVGIAYSLSLMKLMERGDLPLKNLNISFLFTVNEEGGLMGAFNIQKDFVSGKYLINLDSEEDDRYTIGCAGGILTHGYIDLKDMDMKDYFENPKVFLLIVKGLQGGHSGVDIHKERGNAIKFLTRILWRVNKDYRLGIQSLLGGNLHNAIPREAKSIFCIEADQVEVVSKLINDSKDEIISQYRDYESDMELIFKEKKTENHQIYSQEIKDDLLNILYAMPHGPIKYHPNNRELVHTSTNLAAVKIQERKLEILTSQRSLENITRRIMYETVESIFKLPSLEIKVEFTQKYPGWKPDFDSNLLKIAKESYNDLFESDPVIQTIHAGLECGIIKENLEDTEMISLGPSIKDAHSPDERLKIISVRKVWKLINEIIRKIDEN